MKILFLGDYSNLHTLLAAEMRRRGHDVTLVSDRCNHMGLDCDIFLDRAPGWRGSARYVGRILSLLPRLRGYDVVQLVNPHFMKLRPERLRMVASYLRRHNGSLFLSLAGNDSVFVERCLDGSTFRFSEFRVGMEPTEFSRRRRGMEEGYLLPEVRDYTAWLYDRLDGAMAVLPEYHMAAAPLLGERVCFTNLPADLTDLPFSHLPQGKIRILTGMRSGYELPKGTDTLLKLSQRVEARMPDIVESVNVRDLPWTEYKRVLASCHINLDQLYSYSPAMNALSSMALGRVAATGAQPEYYSMIGEETLRPLITLSPLEDDMEDKLCALVADHPRLEQMGREGRRLVEKHNSVQLVADRYESHWKKRLEKR